nr:polysaccharide deacetylase family protein [Halorubellus sp. JP-L1]
MAWGFADRDDPPVERVEAARDAWTWLLDLFDEHSVPATWAVVGHLFLEDCDGRHATQSAPDDWFAFERTTYAKRPDLRFGPDLVDAIAAARADHEIGSHSFAHLLFDDDDLSRTAADADVERAVAVAADHGIDLDAFVFPRNVVGHRDVLADHGFRTYRAAGAGTRSRLARVTGKLRGVMDPDRLPLVEPTVDEHGLVAVPPSLYLFGFEGVARDVLSTVWTDPVVRQAHWLVDRAATEDGVCHLWLHPNNVVDDAARDRLRAIVEHVGRRRDQGLVDVETMGDVADRVLEDDATHAP